MCLSRSLEKLRNEVTDLSVHKETRDKIESVLNKTRETSQNVANLISRITAGGVVRNDLSQKLVGSSKLSMSCQSSCPISWISENWSFGQKNGSNEGKSCLARQILRSINWRIICCLYWRGTRTCLI